MISLASARLIGHYALVPDRRAKPSETTIADAARRYPVGAVAHGTVAEVWTFGIVIDLPDAPLATIVTWPHVDPAGALVRHGSDDAPRVGDTRDVVIVAHQLERRQIAASCRLADFPEV